MSRKESSNKDQASKKSQARARTDATEQSWSPEMFLDRVSVDSQNQPGSTHVTLMHHDGMHQAQKISLARQISKHQGNRHLAQLLAADSGTDNGVRETNSAYGKDTLQRQEGPLGPGPRPEYLEDSDSSSGETKEEKRYSITLTTGARADLTEADAIGLLREVAYQTNHNLEMAKGEHELLKKTRDESTIVGVGGWLTDLFGEDLPPLSIWDEAIEDTARARVAVAMRDVEGAASALIDARASYDQANKKWLEYKNQLENAGNLATAAVVIVAVVAITVAVVATPAIAGGAAGGGTTAGGTTAGGAAAAEATAAGASTTGTVVVGGGVGGPIATGATLPGVDLVMMLVSRIGAMLASGNTAAATTVLTAYSSTPTGRQTLLRCAQVIVANMQQPGLTREEFQMLKQLSETFFLFARGG